MRKVKLLVISVVAALALSAGVASMHSTKAFADTLSDIPGSIQSQQVKETPKIPINSSNINGATSFARSGLSNNFYIYNIPGVQRIQYGTSGYGRPLYYYKIGNGQNTLFANFAIHGYEDSWAQDGYQLTRIAHQLIEKFNYKNKTSGLNGWSVIIIPCANPDGILDGWTNNGPGRTQVSHKIDLNRDFPTYFKPEYNARNYTGPNPLGAPEASALANLVNKISRESRNMVLLDTHGWLDMTIGDPQIGQPFINSLGLSHNAGYKPAGHGYLISYGHAEGAEVSLVELPWTTSEPQVDSRNYVGKMYNAMNQVMNNNGFTYMNKTGIVTGTSHLNIRSGATTVGTILGGLNNGDSVHIVGTIDGWYKIYKPGIGYAYVSGNYITITGDGDSIPNSQTGWHYTDGYWKYFDNNGIPLKGYQEINGQMYHFDGNGAMYTGWLNHNGNLYYVTDNHQNVKGWYSIDGYTRYFTQNGTLVSPGWHDIEGYWRYFDNSGVAYKGYQNINGQMYHFDGNGAMYTGWLNYNGNLYYVTDNHQNVKGWYSVDGYTRYFTQNGTLVSPGWHDVEGYWRYFDNSGVAYKGYQNIDNQMYQFDKNGAMYTGWLNYNGNTYYVNNQHQNLTGWHDIEGYWRYFNTQGHILKGLQIIDGKAYNFDENGAMYTGWLNYNGNLYYINNQHEYTTGWLWISGYTRYFTQDGTLISPGWHDIEGYWRFFDNSGVAYKGYQNIDNQIYQFDKNGAMYTGWLNINDNTYYVNDEHQNLKGWHEIDGYWRFFDENGVLQKGEQTINGQKYLFDQNGAMYSGTVTIDGQTYYINNQNHKETLE